ncbi:MAG: hypothetical protein IT285_14170 [Bdellovibrionales bacterium]|nr:hypothetical protein [Bdellovibrionales bacterium]
MTFRWLPLPLLFFLLPGAINSTHALELGVQAGAMVGGVTGDSTYNGDAPSTDHSFGLTPAFGATLRLPFGSRFALTASGVLAQRKAYFIYSSDTVSEHEYASLFAMVVPSIRILGPLEIGAGPYLSQWLDKDEAERDPDQGIAVSLGWELPTFLKRPLRIDARYLRGTKIIYGDAKTSAVMVLLTVGLVRI